METPEPTGWSRQEGQALQDPARPRRTAIDRGLLHYDPVADRLVRLELVELHDGIVQKGDFYVSCADFTDEAGVTYDMDFLVLETAEGYRVNQAIVHSVDGKKRKYHIEQRWPGLF